MRHLKKGKKDWKSCNIEVFLHFPGASAKARESLEIVGQYVQSQKMNRCFDIKNTITSMREHLHESLFASPKTVPVLGREAYDLAIFQHGAIVIRALTG